MKPLLNLLTKMLLGIPSFKRPKNNWGGKFENGGKQPPAAPTYEVIFKVY